MPRPLRFSLSILALSVFLQSPPAGSTVCSETTPIRHDAPLGGIFSAWRRIGRLPSGYHVDAAFGGDRELFALVRKGGDHYPRVARARVGGNGQLAPWEVGEEAKVDPRLAVQGDGFVFLLEHGLRVHVARLGGAGGVGPFLQTRSAPEGTWQGGAVVARGHLFLIGGGERRETSRRVFAARIGPDGQLDEWQSVAPLPFRLIQSSVLASGDRIFVVRGYDRIHDLKGYSDEHEEEPREMEFTTNARVLSAKVNGDGSLEPWREEFAALDMDAPVVAAEGLLIAAGGAHGDWCGGTAIIENRTLVARVEPGEGVGWLESSPLPRGSANHLMVAVGRWVYSVGTWGGSDRVEEVWVAWGPKLAPGPFASPAKLMPLDLRRPHCHPENHLDLVEAVRSTPTFRSLLEAGWHEKMGYGRGVRCFGNALGIGLSLVPPDPFRLPEPPPSIPAVRDPPTTAEGLAASFEAAWWRATRAPRFETFRRLAGVSSVGVALALGPPVERDGQGVGVGSTEEGGYTHSPFRDEVLSFQLGPALDVALAEFLPPGNELTARCVLAGRASRPWLEKWSHYYGRSGPGALYAPGNCRVVGSWQR